MAQTVLKQLRVLSAAHCKRSHRFILSLALLLASHARILEVQIQCLTEKKRKNPTTHSQCAVTACKSFQTLTKETPPNLLGRDTALAIKHPEPRDTMFCWHRWSGMLLKGRPRSFFFLFFLSSASYTGLRISDLYYKHTAISFERNRRCSVFL